MGIFSKLLRLEPPRPSARELAEANEFRMKNAKEAAARERQRLIVEWLRKSLTVSTGSGYLSEEAARYISRATDLIEDGEPLRAPRPEGHPPDPRSRR